MNPRWLRFCKFAVPRAERRHFAHGGERACLTCTDDRAPDLGEVFGTAMALGALVVDDVAEMVRADAPLPLCLRCACDVLDVGRAFNQEWPPPDGAGCPCVDMLDAFREHDPRPALRDLAIGGFVVGLSLGEPANVCGSCADWRARLKRSVFS